MTEFNLRSVIADVLDSTDLADPAEVAEEAYRRLTVDDYAAALQQVLRQFARLVMMSRRSHMPVAVHPKAPASWKVAAIREGWRRHLQDRLFTPAGWKLLRDCTRDDLLYIAAERRRIADENLATAERFEKLAGHLVGTATCASLPEDVLADALGRAA